jgi:MarR family
MRAVTWNELGAQPGLGDDLPTPTPGAGEVLLRVHASSVKPVLLASTWWLNEHGERPTQVALATQAGTDIKMTSQAIRSLEAKGLVERAVEPADARARRLRVTRRRLRFVSSRCSWQSESGCPVHEIGSEQQRGSS